MKRKIKMFGGIALAAVIALFLGACGDASPRYLSGNITITPNTGVEIGTELTASYSGIETVDFQWQRGRTNVGTNSNKYEVTEDGSYTVTVSAPGFVSKTSSAVVVSGCIHEWGSWLITAYPTAAANGVETRTCSLCGGTETSALTLSAFQSYFYGTWVSSNNLIREISADTVTASGGNWSYEITGLTITPVTNTIPETMADYPFGFKYKGTIANKTGGNWTYINQETGISETIVDGLVYSTIFYLHPNKGSFSLNGNSGAGIYTKQ